MDNNYNIKYIKRNKFTVIRQSNIFYLILGSKSQEFLLGKFGSVGFNNNINKY